MYFFMQDLVTTSTTAMDLSVVHTHRKAHAVMQYGPRPSTSTRDSICDAIENVPPLCRDGHLFPDPACVSVRPPCRMLCPAGPQIPRAFMTWSAWLAGVPLSCKFIVCPADCSALTMPCSVGMESSCWMRITFSFKLGSPPPLGVVAALDVATRVAGAARVTGGGAWAARLVDGIDGWRVGGANCEPAPCWGAREDEGRGEIRGGISEVGSQR